MFLKQKAIYLSKREKEDKIVRRHQITIDHKRFIKYFYNLTY